MKRVWIEKSYKKNHPHRVEGDRAVGKAIWSPTTNKGGQNIYKNMKLVSPGDIILHLVDNKYISSSSLVVSKKIEIVNGLDPNQYDKIYIEKKGHERFFRKENFLWKLGYNKKFLSPILVKDLLQDIDNYEVLDLIRESSEVVYTKNYRLREGAYLTPVSKEFLTFLNRIFSTINSGLDIPSVTKNLLYDHTIRLEDLFEKEFDKISTANKDIGGSSNYKENHDKDLRLIASHFKKFNFDYINLEPIRLRPAGDIDLVMLYGKSIIIADYKRGKNLEKEFNKWNSSKRKFLSYLYHEHPETKEKFDNVSYLMIGRRLNEKTLNNLFKKLVKNNQIEEEGSTELVKGKKIDISSHKIIHYSQLEHYFDLSQDIDPNYARRDFFKDFNIKPKNRSVMTVPAVKVDINHDKHKQYCVYNFSCSATELLKFAAVARRTPVSEGITNYQRVVDSKRIKNIGENFLTKNQGFFPNNIILKLEKSKIEFNSKLELIDDESISGFKNDFGLLSIDEDYNSAWVIDGQHRLFSYLKTTKEKTINDTVNVAAIVGVPPEKEVEYFLDINDKSKPVPTDLIWDLNGDMNENSPEGIISNAFKIMFSKDNSYNPFFRHISIPSLKKRGGLKFSSLCNGFKFEILGGNIAKETFNKHHGDKPINDVKNPYSGVSSLNTSKNIANAFIDYYEELGKNLDKNKQKLLFQNTNFMVLMNTLADRYFKYHERMKIVNDEYFKVLGNYLESLSKDKIELYKKMSNAELRREGIRDLIYYLKINYKSDFHRIPESQLIKDIRYFTEHKFGMFIYKVIKDRFGVNFVMNAPKFKSHYQKLIRRNNLRGEKYSEDEMYKGLLFYSQLWEGFVKNDDALYIVDEDIRNKFSDILNPKSNTINVWEHCFKDIFLPTNKSKAFFKDDAVKNAIEWINEYSTDFRHEDNIEKAKSENFDPSVRDLIKTNYNLINEVIDIELKKLNTL